MHTQRTIVVHFIIEEISGLLTKLLYAVAYGWRMLPPACGLRFRRTVPPVPATRRRAYHKDQLGELYHNSVLLTRNYQTDRSEIGPYHNATYPNVFIATDCKMPPSH